MRKKIEMAGRCQASWSEAGRWAGDQGNGFLHGYFEMEPMFDLACCLADVGWKAALPEAS
jgi:hypothetical protein